MSTISEFTDITPDTTSEEIKSYAEQVVQDIKAERAGESKSDAQIANEHAGTAQPGDKPAEETIAEDNSGNTTAKDEGETTGSAPESPEWLTDDVKAEAAAYGIEEAELADFASREELDRVLRIFDKRAMDAGRKALEGEAQARNEKGQFVKKEEAKAEQPKEVPRGGQFELSQEFQDTYDDTIVATIKGMRDHYEARFAELEAQVTQANRAAEAQQFDSEIDKLDMPKIFGKAGDETAEELQRRQSVMAQAKVLQAGHTVFGLQVPMATLVKQAAQAMFPKDFEKQLLKQHTRKISKQSDRRMGGSPTKPTPPSEDPRAKADRLYAEISKR